MPWPNHDLHMTAPNGAELHAQIIPDDHDHAEVVFLSGDDSTWVWDAEACALAATFFTELSKRLAQ